MSMGNIGEDSSYDSSYEGKEVAPTKDTEIGRCLARLTGIIDRANKAIEQLEKQLEPVLSESPPRKETGQETEMLVTPLGKFLDEKIGEIEIHVNFINELKERVAV